MPKDRDAAIAGVIPLVSMWLLMDSWESIKHRLLFSPGRIDVMRQHYVLRDMCSGDSCCALHDYPFNTKSGCDICHRFVLLVSHSGYLDIDRHRGCLLLAEVFVNDVWRIA
jgi:hypothetical protein